jgi:fumarate hydratase class II
MPLPLIRAFGLQKRAAALANLELGALELRLADGIIAAAEEVALGRLDGEFPLSVWQSGSGTQTHMNVNEVIAHRASEILGYPLGTPGPVHPNDHVNLGQSTNDSFPTALHVAVVRELTGKLLPALRLLHSALQARAAKFDDVIKLGRTHYQDAVPMTSGQEIRAWATQVANGALRVEATLPRLRELPQGGTAVGTGLNARRGFAAAFARQIAQLTGEPFRPAKDPFEAIAARDAIVEAHAALAVVATSLTKIANDVRLLASGPRGGFAELRLPENEPGSSIMPGKVNPTQAEALVMIAARVIGNHAAVTTGALGGQLQLCTSVPLMAECILQSIELLDSGVRSFAAKCVAGLEPDRDRARSLAESSLMLVTALAPVVGHERAAQIARKALRDGTTLREPARALGLASDDLERLLEPETMLGK